jgi:hypothetical protein
LLTPPVYRTGFGNHGDYLFGWKDDSLQKIMDEECYVSCRAARQQSIAEMNQCTVKATVSEDIDSCKSGQFSLLGGCYR